MIKMLLSRQKEVEASSPACLVLVDYGADLSAIWPATEQCLGFSHGPELHGDARMRVPALLFDLGSQRDVDRPATKSTSTYHHWSLLTLFLRLSLVFIN
jgi:hypothetical protein